MLQLVGAQGTRQGELRTTNPALLAGRSEGVQDFVGGEVLMCVGSKESERLIIVIWEVV